MTYSFDAWTTSVEDPIGAAIRADVTSHRRVIDAAHDYQSAIARGNKTEALAAKAAFRQAWETDVRRKGGQPEDFIPNYSEIDPIPVSAPHGLFFGQTTPTAMADSRSPIIQLMSTMAILYILWMFLS